MISKMLGFRSIVALASSMLVASAATAANGGGEDPAPISNPAYYEQNILSRSGETVEPLGPNLMGDTLNEYSGGLGFSHTDVSLPGNNALPVAVGRVLAVGTRQAIAGLLGDWDIDIPHLHTVAFATNPDWYGGDGFGSFNQNRCSQFTIPPTDRYLASSKYVNLRPEGWWDGYHLYVPGSGDQTLLSRAGGPPTNPIQPTDGGNYPVVTKQHWQLACLPSLERGTGEGFLARAPDGTRYRFDHLVQRAHPGLDVRPYGTKARIEIWILPTLVTDRFGNWVRYTYGGADGGQLTSIQSSDGRSISLTYNGWGNRVGSVSDGTRTWTYGYDDQGALRTVTQPDGSQWQFSLGDLERDPFRTGGCANNLNYSWDYATHVGTIAHPSGALGTFAVKMAWHGRSNVPGDDIACEGPYQVNGVTHINEVPLFSVSYSLASKTLSGPGMPPMTWSYAYNGIPGCFAPCDGVKTVTITDPQGSTTRNIYGTQFGINDGLLLASTVSDGSGTLRTTNYAYQASNAGPYPAVVGYNGGAADSMNRIFTPQRLRSITQQGVTFEQTNSAFDAYARPTSVVRSSSLGQSRTESTDFFDQTNLWVLGQVRSHTVAGVQVSATTFDEGGTALPSAFYRFGKLLASYSFNGDGTLASARDGLNHATTFSNYVRGLPQAIGYADGTGISAIINNVGTIASVTNEAGTTWNFGYDAMGRLATKTPPAGDPVAYNPTLFSFVQVPIAEVGLEANHWRQTIQTGNAITVNYFDARWRKRLTTTYDANDPGGTQRTQRFDYDAYNRTTFASYPLRTLDSVAQASPGVLTTYDALGRTVRTIADSELGPLATTTEYLYGFQKRVTNPRGYSTTTSFQVFDEPGESAITAISAPEGVRVDIARDAFGKPASITRSGSFAGSGPASVTRTYVYDANHRLCKTIEPEIGATIQVLDDANNVTSRAIGVGATNAASCDISSMPADKEIRYAYDARNRNTATDFADGSPSIVRSYTPDGLLASISSGGAVINYGYNNHRLLVAEVLNYGGWTLGRAYDANAHESQLTYPDGAVASFAPNALGEATQVSGYLTGVTYHPNGAVAGYTLANGTAHSQAQNVRGLPSINRDLGVFQDRYSYDADGNIVAIIDEQEGISTRGMAYDGLDRLIAATAPNLWGNAIYSYDGLNNLRASSLGNRSSAHQYDAKNRLSSITTNGVDTAYTYDSQGNVTSRGAQLLVFDQGNRLTSAGASSYAYDGHGHRILSHRGDGSVVASYYSQSGQLLFGQRLEGGINHFTRYVYLAGKPVAETHSDLGTVFLHTDVLGSPIARVGAAFASVSYACPAGWTLAGTTCTQANSTTTAATLTGYSCPPGYTLAGSVCTATTTSTTPATVTYGCPSSWSLSGSNCISRSSVPATAIYACPAGFNLSGSTCSGTATSTASASLSCKGYGPMLAYAGSPTGYKCQTTSILMKMNPDALELCRDFASSRGLPLVGTPISAGFMQCVTGPVSVYTCPAGATQSGNTCVSPVTQSAGVAGYTCASGTLSGTSCISSASAAASVNYSCPSEQTLAGQTCTLTNSATIASTPIYECSAGAVLSGSSCLVQGTASQPATASYGCPNGGTVSGSQCVGMMTRTRYEPYGNTAVGEVPKSLGFSGHVNDAETGLVYMQQRYYDPVAGRFLSIDPVTTDFETGKLFNIYEYGHSNPYRFTDPDGREPACSTALSGCTVIQVADAAGAPPKSRSSTPISETSIVRWLRNSWYATEADGLKGGIEKTLAGLPPVVGALTKLEALAAKSALPSAGGVVRQFEQVGDKTYYRVFSGDASVGGWLTSVPPRSSSWAQEALALPPGNKATFIQDVLVPSGTLLERSRAIPVPEWGRLRGGAEQFKLLDEIPRGNFGTGRPLP